jgi:hypothetical protein
MKIRIFQILNLLGLCGVIAVNYLANALPIAGKTTGELSDLYPSLFTPAGFTFGIWGVIYLLLIIFAVYQAKGLFGNSNIPQNEYIRQIGPWFFVSSLTNISWIFAWHHQVVWLSMLIMIVFLISLISAYLRLGIGQRIVSKNQRYFVNMPFSVYLGWITVATIANASTLLIHYNWSGFGISGEQWTIIMIAAATLINLIILFRRKDLFYSLVIIWALAGIIYKRTQPEEEFYLSVVIAAFSGIFLIASTIVYQAVKRFTMPSKKG